jgi:MAGE family
MPRRTSKHRIIQEDEEESDGEENQNHLDSSSSIIRKKGTQETADDEEAEDDDEMEEVGTTAPQDDDGGDGNGGGTLTFTSQAPEMTQDIAEVKDSERRNLINLTDAQREKAVMDLSRLVLFKAMAGESIDRAKCIKEAKLGDARISTAVFEEATVRLKNCFGFEVKRMPVWMEKWKTISKTLKDRYYVINAVPDETGKHSKSLHAYKKDAAVEKGFIMVVLALCYCQGKSRSDGSRWITDTDLYKLLNRLDDSMPDAPPAQGSKRGASQPAVSESTPNIDVLLPKLVQRDYLLKEKNEEEGEGFLYCIGPRSVIEVGRHQVLTFCSEILGEDIDPTMLAELETLEQEDE